MCVSELSRKNQQKGGRDAVTTVLETRETGSLNLDSHEFGDVKSAKMVTFATLVSLCCRCDRRDVGDPELKALVTPESPYLQDDIDSLGDAIAVVTMLSILWD